MKKLIFAMAVVAASAATAEVSFSYQGALKTATGENIPANESNKTISFRLYDTPTGEGALWGRTIAVHLDANGLFNAELANGVGSDVGNAKTNDLAWVLSEYPGKDKALYIGLDVQGSSGEIRPRQKLLNVPTAAFAADVSQAKRDFTVDGVATFKGAINAQSGVTVSGALKAENGLTVTSGGLTVSGGALKAEKGLTVTSGGLTVSGELRAENGLTVSGGGFTVPNGGIIPKGGIIMWSGTDIPQGWALCDGNNGTPDLRNRFIVGAGGKYGSGNTGGEEMVTLSTDQMPNHIHTFEAQMKTISTAGNVDIQYWNGYRSYGWFVRWVGQGDGVNDGWNGTKYKRPEVQYGDDVLNYIKVSPQGNGQAHNNLPPYYALCFIMKL